MSFFDHLNSGNIHSLPAIFDDFFKPFKDKYMPVFDHLNSDNILSLPAIFDDLIKPFKVQHSRNTRGATKYGLNIPKMKTSFSGSRSAQVKSIKDRNNITDKIHFTTTEDLMLKL